MHHVAVIREWNDGTTDEVVVSRKTKTQAQSDADAILELNAKDGFGGDLRSVRIQSITYKNGYREVIP